MKMEQTLPAELREARRRFEDWRRKKIKGSTIPEPLWEGAAKLAAIHGVSRVSHLLSLDYYNLKERAKAAESKAKVDAGGLVPGFVELNMESLLGSRGCTIRIEKPDGPVMTVGLGVGSELDLVEVAQGLWRGCQ